MNQTFDLDRYLSGSVYALLLIFCRLGMALYFMPGFSDAEVVRRFRLGLALILSFVLLPVIKPVLPPQPTMAIGLFVLVGQEMIVGIFLGMVVRILIAAIDVGGQFISQQIGLSNANLFNPSLATQSTLVSLMLIQAATALVFYTDIDHLMITALADSYTIFKPGHPVPVGDMSSYLSEAAGQCLVIGAEIAAPFLIVAILSNIGLAILTKLMPQLQILPLFVSSQSVTGLILLTITVGAIMTFWLERFTEGLRHFTAGSG